MTNWKTALLSSTSDMDLLKPKAETVSLDLKWRLRDKPNMPLGDLPASFFTARLLPSFAGALDG